MKEQNLYTIGEIASLCHIPIKTLRYYDQVGLIHPRQKNDTTGYRYYGKEQIFEIQFIKVLRSLHFSISEVRKILANRNTREFRNSIKEQLDALQKDITALQATHLSGTLLLERLEEGTILLERSQPDTSTELKLEDFPERHVLFVRRQLKHYRNEEPHIELWSEVMQLAQKTGAILTGGIYVKYHHQPLEHFYTKDCDYEVGLPILKPPQKDVHYCRREAAFHAVTLCHVGSYHGLIAPYLKAMKWIQENDYEICGPARDVFLISSIDTENIDEWCTKIVIPVRKKQ